MSGSGATISTLFTSLTGALSGFVTLFFALAFAVFIIGLIKLIRKSGDDQEIAAGKKQMMWGVIGLFLIASMWGIVWLAQTLILGGSTPGSETCTSTYIDVGGGTFTGEVCP